MAVTDLTGYTWVGNEVLTGDYVGGQVNFSSNNEDFAVFGYAGTLRYGPIEEPSSPLTVWTSNGGWSNEAYKTIQIIGGPDATNATLISWLESNGTLTAPQSQLSVDLTTLTGWSDVSAGSHTLKVKAKATGYRDSALSTGVSFTKAGGGN